MIRRRIILFASIFFNLQLCFGAEEGFFNLQNGSQYLGFSNMNKEFGITSLMNSAIANDAQATQIFIRSGDNVDQRNIAGATALHLAARNGSYESAKILVEAGANVNARDNEGWTPLMRASLAGNQPLIELLINNSADVWAVNQNNDSALVHTAMANCYECAKTILSSKSHSNDRILKKGQIFRASEIVKKRYNEPFMELLNGQDVKNSNTIINIVDEDVFGNREKNDGDSNNITKLIYVFTGKVITNDELKKLSKENYSNSLKAEKDNVKEKKLEPKKNKVVEMPVVESTIKVEDAEYEFKGNVITQKEIDRQKKDMMKSMVPAKKKETQKTNVEKNNKKSKTQSAEKKSSTVEATKPANQKQNIEKPKSANAPKPEVTKPNTKAVETTKSAPQNAKTAEPVAKQTVQNTKSANAPKTNEAPKVEAKNSQTIQQNTTASKNANSDLAAKALKEREIKKKTKQPIKEIDKPVEVKEKKITYTPKKQKPQENQPNSNAPMQKNDVKYTLQNDDSKLTYTPKKSSSTDKKYTLGNDDTKIDIPEKTKQSPSGTKKYTLKDDSGSLN